MKIRWLLETDIFNSEMKPFVETLERMGIAYAICDRVYNTFVPLFSDPDYRTIVHGSFQLAKFLKQNGVTKGLYCNLPKFDCTYYYPRFSLDILNDNYVVIPFGTLKARYEWFYEQIGTGEYLFIRPNGNDKEFAGQVIPRRDWADRTKLFKYKLDPESLIVVSRPVNLHREWRMTVVNNEIISGSQYKEDERILRKPGVPDDVLAWAGEMLKNKNFNPEKVWTLDVCETADKKLKVLETGPFSCTGLYSADFEKIIQCVGEASL